ncbi:uncharacterized protein LOC125676693 isoform X1 [Ostrea edulis]|uniref:uncharacterized protein LOC125676693 isoform X1 n=1 Tax=Ostrea edulis TaxID=37623 RepID=UPI0024AF0EFC|nr:uncharacterized protein LOC125676693 isoform X1 [Ostrea edulis]
MMACTPDLDVVSTTSQNESQDLLTVEEILYYPLLFLKVCGIYEHNGNKLKTRTAIGKLVFNVIFVLAYVYIDIRIIVGFIDNGDFSDQLMGRIVIAVMYISNTLLFPFLMVTTRTRLPGILLRFSRFQSVYGFTSDVRKLRSVVAGMSVVLSVSVVIIGVSIITLTSSRILEESGLLINRLLPFRYEDGYIFDVVSVVEIVVTQYWSLFYDSELVVVYLLSHMIIQEFQEMTRKVDATRKKRHVSPTEIQRMRQQHHAVSGLLQKANSVIALNVLLTYMTLLPSTCFTVYGIVYSTLGTFDVMLLIAILVMQLLGMILMTSIGAKLHSQAHGALGGLFALSLKNLSSEAQYQLQMFISQLSDQTIGINVCGLFTMDGSTFLMIFGTVVTYTVVVLQIQAGSCNITHVNNCNCTV